MPPLYDGTRRQLFGLSAALCTIALLLMPLAARSAFAPNVPTGFRPNALRVAAVATAAKLPSIVVTRDPFVADKSDSQTLATASAPAQAPAIVGLRVTQGESMGFALPPNQGAGQGFPNALGPQSTIVRAVVTGASARALIEENGDSRIVSIGDAVAGSRVVRIDRTGIGLADGSMVPLAKATP